MAKNEGSYRHSLSILSSIARLFAKKEPSTRLSESFKARYPAAVSTLTTVDSHSALPSQPPPTPTLFKYS